MIPNPTAITAIELVGARLNCIRYVTPMDQSKNEKIPNSEILVSLDDIDRNKPPLSWELYHCKGGRRWRWAQKNKNLGAMGRLFYENAQKTAQ